MPIIIYMRKKSSNGYMCVMVSNKPRQNKMRKKSKREKGKIVCNYSKVTISDTRNRFPINTFFNICLLSINFFYHVLSVIFYYMPPIICHLPTWRYVLFFLPYISLLTEISSHGTQKTITNKCKICNEKKKIKQSIGEISKTKIVRYIQNRYVRKVVITIMYKKILEGWDFFRSKFRVQSS